MTAKPSTTSPVAPTPLIQAAGPVIVLIILITYGLILRPLMFGQPQLPLEILFILAASAAVIQLLLTGHRWADIQDSITAKFQAAIPAFLILFSIGLLIPPAIVLIGSLRKMPPVPVLLSSVFAASGLAMVFQQFSLTDVVASVYKGFHTDMAPWAAESLSNLLVEISGQIATLGVPLAEFWHWQLLSLTNFVVAITGIGCFYGKRNEQGPK